MGRHAFGQLTTKLREKAGEAAGRFGRRGFRHQGIVLAEGLNLKNCNPGRRRTGRQASRAIESTESGLILWPFSTLGS